MKTDALRYARDFGWPVFPVKAGAKIPLTACGFKDASTDPAQIEAWWTECPDANIGVPTGAVSGIFAIDADVKNGQPGHESFKVLKLPATLISRTPSGGWHAIFRHQGDTVRNRTGLLPGIDVRGDGGYIVVPPSQINGDRYIWYNEVSPWAPPEHLLKRLAKQNSTLPTISGRKIGQGGRNDYLARQGGALRGQGVQQGALEAALLAENCARCEPPLPEREVRRNRGQHESLRRAGNWQSGMAGPDVIT